ncbi:ABC transporter substrate-binding protein [Streptomyces sulphureus]|uniref:ABC transporter substrate-binding protein n=1 Tax=Streptomyces sulphureus TaxID=47758 RepID=UPI0003609505|nr:ABC transporter substrate-binding protein [Streptomyces sulphureus]
MSLTASRTRRAAVVAALAGAVVLTGCGGEESSSSSKPAADAGTRTVTGADGKKAEVPEKPKKIVTLSEPTLDAALALGHQPVGATAGRGQQGVSSYLAKKAAKAKVVATVAEPDLEKLAVLKPDLILLDETTGSKRVTDKLRQIAPTVLTAKLNEDWQKSFLATADALGDKAKAQKWIEEFDADVRETKNGLEDNAEAVTSVVRWQDGAPSVVGKGKGHVGSTLASLGLKRPKDQQGESLGHSEPVSLEKLRTIDGDWLFFGTLDDRASGEKALKEAKDIRNFTRLDAVRDDHVVVVEGSAWNSAGGPLAARAVLADVKGSMAE